MRQLLRYKITIAYCGANYHGWQRQMPTSTWKGPAPATGQGIPTVQQTVARALGHVVGHPVNLVGSSRTDAGVHAKAQVAHFDTDQAQIPVEGMRMAANHKLPDDVLIRAIEPVDPRFDAISSTVAKRYQYFIWAADDRNPLVPSLCWHRWEPMDIPAMQAAAAHLVGRRDFSSFARAGHGRDTTVRSVLDCSVSRSGSKLVIGIAGDGFLWNMVRIMVGTLVQVGIGQFSPADIPRMLEARDRRAAGLTAPPHGLYLQWIRFKDFPAPPGCAAPPDAATRRQGKRRPRAKTDPRAATDPGAATGPSAATHPGAATDADATTRLDAATDPAPIPPVQP